MLECICVSVCTRDNGSESVRTCMYVCQALAGFALEDCPLTMSLVKPNPNTLISLTNGKATPQDAVQPLNRNTTKLVLKLIRVWISSISLTAFKHIQKMKKRAISRNRTMGQTRLTPTKPYLI